MPKKKNNDKKIFYVIAVMVVIVLAVLVVLYFNSRDYLHLAKRIKEQAKTDQHVLQNLNKIIDLPQDVEPMMALVTDAGLVKQSNPDFFAKVQNGYRVIIYPNLTILYDPVQNKIINLKQVQISPESIGVVSFALYNGTDDDSVLDDFEQNLTDTFKNAQVRVKEKANNKYDESLVIDLKGDNPEIPLIAEKLGAKVSDLPEDESAPENISVLIIVGENK